MSMNREQLIRICLDSGVVRRDVAIKLIETIEDNEREACVKVIETCKWPVGAEHPYDTREVFVQVIQARGKQ